MTSRRLLQRNNRRGAALIEFAICLPVFLAITFGTLETCRMLYLRQSIKIAAYECARLAIVPKVTSADVQDMCVVFLENRDVKEYSLTLNPADPKAIGYGDLLVVTVDANADANSIVGAWFYQGKVLTESVTIMGEY